MEIAEALGVGYEQAFVLPDGEKNWHDGKTHLIFRRGMSTEKLRGS